MSKDFWLVNEHRGKREGPFTSKTIPLMKAEERGGGWHCEFPDGEKVWPVGMGDVDAATAVPSSGSGIRWVPVTYIEGSEFTPRIPTDAVVDIKGRLQVIVNENIHYYHPEGGGWKGVSHWLYIPRRSLPKPKDY